MPSSSLIRLAGLAAVLSGASSVTGDFLSLVVDLESAESVGSHGPLRLRLLAVPARHDATFARPSRPLRQPVGSGGRPGARGFLVAFLGTALISGALWFELFITPSLATEAPELAEAELGLVGFILSFLLVIVGWFLFGVATLSARIYPRWAAVLLIVGAAVSFVPIPLSGIVLSVAVAWLGFVLFTGRGMSSEQPSRAS